jgi:hemin uptake protein HemP
MNAQTDTQLFTEAAIPVHEATTLTDGGNQARILLNGQIYALRITRAGKLILTK